MSQNQDYTQDTYQTGSTCPPKSYGGLVAFLLVLVIFLCGIITALGLMNVHLFRQLNNAPDPNSLEFSQATEATLSRTHQILGFSTQDMPEFWRVYPDMPRGVFISDVEETSDAAAQGIQPGDILLKLDGEQIADTAALDAWLASHWDHTTAQVLIFRNGKQISKTMALQRP